MGAQESNQLRVQYVPVLSQNVTPKLRKGSPGRLECAQCVHRENSFQLHRREQEARTQALLDSLAQITAHKGEIENKIAFLVQQNDQILKINYNSHNQIVHYKQQNSILQNILEETTNNLNKIQQQKTILDAD